MNSPTKSAIVTGSSRGVGRATALALARQGYAIAVNYSSSKDEAENVVRQIESYGGLAIAVQANVSDNRACKELVSQSLEAFGRLDVLVNNAGVTSFIPHNALEQVHDEDWDRILGVNLIGPFQMVRAAMPALTASGNGAIVNVASIA